MEKPVDVISALAILGGIIAFVSFVLIRDRRKQANPVPFAEVTRNVKRDVDAFFEGLSSMVGGIVVLIIGAAVLLGGLWLVIAVVKWMWQHS